MGFAYRSTAVCALSEAVREGRSASLLVVALAFHHSRGDAEGGRIPLDGSRTLTVRSLSRWVPRLSSTRFVKSPRPLLGVTQPGGNSGPRCTEVLLGALEGLLVLLGIGLAVNSISAGLVMITVGVATWVVEGSVSMRTRSRRNMT